MAVVYAARSHVGWRREENEDNLYADGVTLPPDICRRPFSIDGSAAIPAIFAVCDGMGGEADGADAARQAAELLRRHGPSIKVSAPDALTGAVQDYADAVNRALRQGRRGAARRGTTLAAAVAAADGVHCFNMGDSRIYCLGQEGFQQVTRDHTAGAAQGRSHQLTRCMGIGDLWAVESYPPLRGQCRLLLCSDGLTDMVPPPDLEETLRRCAAVSQAADRLVQLALEGGGRDNITVIVADIGAPAPSPALRRTITLKG